MIENEDDQETSDSDDEDQHTKCCTVISPRVCKKEKMNGSASIGNDSGVAHSALQRPSF